jgi:hypothetical protein
MKFIFTKDELQKFTTDRNGCNKIVLDTQTIKDIKVEQRKFSYDFEFHLSTHGDKYVYIRPDSVKGKVELDRIFLTGSKRGSYVGMLLSGSAKSDAQEVVRANEAIFIKLYDAFNS